MRRRALVAELARLGLGAWAAPLVWHLLAGPACGAAADGPHPASHWHAADGGVRCDLCPRREMLADGGLGFCRVRQNRGGAMVTHGYDRPCILNVDPIEKGPFAHVLPGSSVLAAAHAGCNLRCQYCQNWQASQRSPAETHAIAGFTQAEAVAGAEKRELRGVTFTYTEPSVCAEFVADLAGLARSKGLTPTLCTCGYILEKPFTQLAAPMAAVTVTYKGPTEEFYAQVCQAGLKPVLDTMLLAKSLGKWLEVATLVVTTLNDDPASLKTMAAWIAKNLGADTPWHLERFEPQYKLANLPRTPVETLERARAIGREAGLKYVYISNLAPTDASHTYCPGCGKVVIRRLGFKLLSNDLRGGACPHCSRRIPGVWA